MSMSPVGFRQYEADRARADMQRRFFTANDGPPPTEEQRRATADLRGLVIGLGTQIVLNVPPGRNQALALTALEDVLMRCNRGIYAPEEHR